MERNKYQKIVASVLSSRQIAFNPDLAKALGSANAGLFLSQLLFWWDKGNNKNWIYKTIDEVENETTLSRAEQDTAIKICKKFNLLKVERKGIPAKRHFQLDITKIVNLLETTLLKNDNQVCRYRTNLITKSTQSNSETTTENTQRDSFFYKNGNKRRKRPYYDGQEMRWSRNKWWVIPKDGGTWKEFGGKESEIEWKL
ncbi:MAG TPA: hypothetical protein PLA19_01915 [Candidatus Pacearchaeota archaeon]|jgi:hypothetical protein|nr:hypothetical protein [Candidatus Pacearchaeota archaeon]